MWFRYGRTAIVLLCLAAGPWAGAQIGGGRYLSPSAEVQGPVKPGAPFTLVVRLNIAEGYHIQAANAKEPYIPTKVDVTAPPEFRIGAPVYPAPAQAEVAGERIPVFEGQAPVRIAVTPPKDARGRVRLKVAIRYQACNAQSCFPPATADTETEVDLGGAHAAPTPKPPARSAPLLQSPRVGNTPAPAQGSQQGLEQPAEVSSKPEDVVQGKHASLVVRLPHRIEPASPFIIEVQIKLPAGIHIQAHHPAEGFIPTTVKVTAPSGFKVSEPVYPQAVAVQLAGQTIPVYEGNVAVSVPVTAPARIPAPMEFRVNVRYQACNAVSCFPPEELEWSSSPPSSRAPRAEGPDAAGVASAAGITISKIEEYVPPERFIAFLRTGKAGGEGGALQGLLSRSLILALPVIYLLGLALNLTPCVYPIIPITISYFGSQASRQGYRPFALALSYVLGMAVMYSTLGVVAGMTGSLFGSQLQNPWVLAGFAVVMFALALSQFDRRDGTPIWEIQLPGALRGKATGRSGLAGAFLMGVLVGVVAAPCIGPAVVALLQWVAAERSPALGFASFLALSLGLGTPYLVLGTLSGSLQRLPRSGEWMVGVKHIFGMLLLWMGFYYLQPVLNTWRSGLGDIALAATTAVAGVYLVVDRAGSRARTFNLLRRAIGVAGIGLAAWLLRPAPPEAIQWKPYSQEAIDQALANHQKVLVDFSASWCAACKELEYKTFSDPQVARAASSYMAFRADMTDWSGASAQQLKKRYNIVGLPTVVRLVPAE
ncbi:MAG: cytochrome c biogenesis protein CcdA [Chthonomonadales bacterium]